MIRKLKSGQYRLFSQRKNPKTGLRRPLGTFPTRDAAKIYERMGEIPNLEVAEADPAQPPVFAQDHAQDRS